MSASAYSAMRYGTRAASEEHDELRRQVRGALQSSPSYARLPAEKQRSLAKDMVDVLSYVADPAAGDPELAEVARGRGPTAEAMQGKGIAPPTISGVATEKAGESMETLVKAVDFPAFVSSLIDGVFGAIVDASIKQMEAYGELLANVSKSVGAFAEDNFSDDDARSYVANQFPGSLMNSGGQLQFAPGVDSDSEGLPDLNNFLQSKQQIDLSMLEERGEQQKLVKEAKLKMAQMRQQQLATMVLLGINRIVVTDGKINAKVNIDVSATETAKRKTTASHKDSSEHKSSREKTTKKRSFWGTTRSTEKTKVSTKVTSANQSTDKQESEVALKSKAALAGEVSINFKSETFPLERMMDTGQLDAITELSSGGRPPAAPRGSAPAS